jgi:phosphoribosylglycinamide formyltransferase-1
MTDDFSSSLISPPIGDRIAEDRIPLKLGMMASGSGTNFEVVAEAIAAGQLNAQIQCLIYNNPGAKVAARAEDRNIPAILLDHRQFNSREDLDRQIIKTFQEYEVEWIVMAGWMRIVTSVLIDAFPHQIINIHPSLLPSFKGGRAVEEALAAKVKITGCTVHLVTPEVDSGLILIQAAVPVLPDDTRETLHARIQVQEHRILPKAIALAASFGKSIDERFDDDIQNRHDKQT